MSRRLAAILLTDIVGSTETWTQLRPDYKAFRAEHKRRVRTIIERFDSDPQPTGDGFQAILGSVVDAIECACLIQQDLARQNADAAAEPGRAIRVRIMLHAAELWLDPDGEPVTMAFPVLSRLEAHTGAGEITCTAVFEELAREHFLPHRFSNRRSASGKGLPHQLDFWTVNWDESLPQARQLSMPRALGGELDLFLGRAREIGELFAHLEVAGRGSAQFVEIQGPPGIGKTTLVRHFARQAFDADQALILHGRCSTSMTAPFQPFSEALQGFAELAGSHKELLGPGSAVLEDFLGTTADDALDPTTGPQPRADSSAELFDAVAGWLAANARERPILFCIDDLHNADRSTLAMLNHIVRSEDCTRMLFVITARSTTADWSAAYREWLPDLPPRGRSTISLPGLGLKDVNDALDARRNLAGDRPLRPLAERIWRYTAGNPLYLSSFLATPGALDAFESGRDPTSVEEPDVPNRIRELTAVRLRALPTDVQRVASYAAIFGRQFTADELSDAIHMDPAGVAGALRQLVASGLLLAEDHGPGLLYSFSHQILRDAVTAVDGLEDSDGLREMHLELGDHLESRDPAAASIHLAHADDAGTLRRAAAAAAAAAEQAANTFAYALAAEHISRELALLERVWALSNPELATTDSDAARSARVHHDLAQFARRFDLGMAMKHAGDPDASRMLLSLAEDAEATLEFLNAQSLAADGDTTILNTQSLAKDGDTTILDGLRELAGRAVHASLKNSWADTGRVDQRTVEMLRRAISRLERDTAGASAPRGRSLKGMTARLSAALASELSFSGSAADRDERERRSTAAVDITRGLMEEAVGTRDEARAIGDHSRTLERRHGVITEPTGLLDRLQLIEELEVLQGRIDNPRREFGALSLAYWTRMEIGDVVEASKRLDRMLEIADSLDEGRLHALARHWESLRCTHNGHLDEALRLADEALELKERIGDPDAEVLFVGLSYLPHLHRGTLPTLLDRMNKCVDRVPGLVAIKAGISVAHLQSGGGGVDAARRAIDAVGLEDHFGEVAHNDLLVVLALLSLSCSAAGDLERLQLVRDELRDFRFIGPDRTDPGDLADHRYIFNGTSSFGSVTHYLGVADAALGDFDAAEEMFSTAVEHNRRLGAPALVAESECAWAEMLADPRGPRDLARAGAKARTAFDVGVQLGLSKVVERADRLI